MSDITEVTQTAEEAAPIVEAAEAAMKTIANPNPVVLLEDLILVHHLVSEVKAKLAGKPASLALIFNTLFNLS